MSVGFSAADFSIVPNGTQMPLPIRDDQGFQTYSAKIQLPSRTQYNTLAAYLTMVDRIPSLGVMGGLVNIVAGTGKRTLTYPAQNNVEETATAILISISAPLVHMTHSGFITCDCTWLLVDG